MAGFAACKGGSTLPDIVMNSRDMYVLAQRVRRHTLGEACSAARAQRTKEERRRENQARKGNRRFG